MGSDDLLKRIRNRAGRTLVAVARRVDNKTVPKNATPAAAKTTWVPPGHYYSPIPNLEELSARTDLYDQAPRSLPDVPLCPDRQLEILRRFESLREDRLYEPNDERPVRYSKSSMFGQSSAHALNFMLRTLKPKRVVEVGSGFSSAVMLDTDQHYRDNRTAFTFIDPHPERLDGLLTAEDNKRVTVLRQQLQTADRAPFLALGDGDVLFIDSSHVLKTGSDLCTLFFEILPALAEGVYVHFHDVLYPFEYPRSWVEEGRAWNEAYALRLFLAFNLHFEMQFWASYLFRCHKAELERVPEVCADGSSVWIRRVRK